MLCILYYGCHLFCSDFYDPFVAILLFSTYEYPHFYFKRVCFCNVVNLLEFPLHLRHALNESTLLFAQFKYPSSQLLRLFMNIQLIDDFFSFSSESVLLIGRVISS